MYAYSDDQNFNIITTSLRFIFETEEPLINLNLKVLFSYSFIC